MAKRTPCASAVGFDAACRRIVITKNGRPVSRLVLWRKKPDTLFGIDRGKLEILGDVDKPLGVAWEAKTGRVQEEDR